MSKIPFLYKFAEKLNEANLNEEISHYDAQQQVNLLADGSLSWAAVSKKCYTNTHTSAHVVPAHRTPSNKVVPSRYVKGKTDRRSGKWYLWYSQ